MKRAVSCGVADATEPRVQEQVQRLFPPRTEEMPDRVVKGEAISSFKYLREALTNLKDGVSPGAGGFRHEYLSLLGEKMSGEGDRLLQGFATKYVRGELQPWYYTVALSLQAVALYKVEGEAAVRPLGLRCPLPKTLHRMIIQ